MLFITGWKETSMPLVMGLVETVGIILKWVIKCLIRSIGYMRNNSRNNLEAKSSTLRMFCILRDMQGRPDSLMAFATRLDLPNLRGLISIKWFSLFSVHNTSFSSLILSVKNSSSTSTPNLKGFIIYTNFMLFTAQRYNINLR